MNIRWSQIGWLCLSICILLIFLVIWAQGREMAQHQSQMQITLQEHDEADNRLLNQSRIHDEQIAELRRRVQTLEARPLPVPPRVIVDRPRPVPIFGR